MNERDTALMEASCIVAEDEYFAARPQIDDRDGRGAFHAGFKRAWEAAIYGKMRDGGGGCGGLGGGTSRERESEVWAAEIWAAESRAWEARAEAESESCAWAAAEAARARARTATAAAEAAKARATRAAGHALVPTLGAYLRLRLNEKYPALKVTQVDYCPQKEGGVKVTMGCLKGVFTETSTPEEGCIAHSHLQSILRRLVSLADGTSS